MEEKEVSQELKLSDLAIQLPTFDLSSFNDAIAKIELPTFEISSFNDAMSKIQLPTVAIPQDVLDTLSAIAHPFHSDHWKTVVVPYWNRRIAPFDGLEIEYNFILRDSRIILERNKKYIPDFDEFEEWFAVVRYSEYYKSDESIENLPTVSLSDFELFDKYKEQGLYKHYLEEFDTLFSIVDFSQIFLKEWEKSDKLDKQFFKDWLTDGSIKLFNAIKIYYSEDIKRQYLIHGFIKWLTELTAETMPKEENGELFNIDFIKRINEYNNKEKIFEPLTNEQLSKALNDPENYGNLLKFKRKMKFSGLIFGLGEDAGLDFEKQTEWAKKIIDNVEDITWNQYTAKRSENKISL